MSSGSGISCYDPLQGRVHDRLGCIPFRSDVGGGVVGGQLSEHINVLEMRAVLLTLPAGQGHLSGDRQLHYGGLSAAPGGHPFPGSVCFIHPGPVAVSGDQSRLHGEAPSRSSECSGQHSVSVSEPGSHRTDPQAFGVPISLPGLGQTPCGSVRHGPELLTPYVCVSGSRSYGHGGGCSIPGLVGNVRVCVSSLQSGGQGVGEDSSTPLYCVAGCTDLASTTLVSSVALAFGGLPAQHPPPVGSSVSTEVPAVLLGTRTAPPSRLDAISEGSLRRAFLEKLFQDKGLSPGTIAAYRSAIASVLAFYGSKSVGSDASLSALIRGFYIEKPRSRQLVPRWNLALVLDSLLRAPFEPLQSTDLKFLTFKTVFFIAFASGRRRSDIHAFSRSPSCLLFSAHHSSVSVTTDPSFLAKNQVPGFTPGLVVIPSLASTLDGDCPDRLLCPVRALRYYLARTEGGGGHFSRLFQSLQPGRSDISAATISLWIVQTVRAAYESAGDQSLRVSGVRAHEVCALATLWALFNGSSYAEVMTAAVWRGHSTFTEFYLRSLSGQSDGLYSLGPLVAAQSVVCPPSSFA
ncbi:uncharacterized protein LOC110452315 [Mizuhopecten yessoensis]|uniref:uncharacterized protein LOC110452315 n=1 Tax=Mizuhopecten yessoensis TaxID=6573 RepID=UPI000B45AB5D|nr:uncharacterized protein LOC110452315 [Mizuhopecten yessoensis]